MLTLSRNHGPLRILERPQVFEHGHQLRQFLLKSTRTPAVQDGGFDSASRTCAFDQRSVLHHPYPAEEDSMLTYVAHTERPNDGLIATKQSKSRKRPAVSTGPVQTQEFFFVDSASSTREKRAHVMRHHIQAKRKQHMLATQADRQLSRSPRYLPWRKKSDADAQAAGEASSMRHISPQDDSSVWFRHCRRLYFLFILLLHDFYDLYPQPRFTVTYL